MSRRILIKLAALASTCWMSVGYALAENRIALVIGNANYTSVTALPNPANDARAMTTFLHSAGFEVVQAPDLTQSDMRTTIGKFATRVAEKGPDTVALVFYAGHGLQVDGENFLVPVDAHIEREADVPLQSMRLADLMHTLSSVPSKTRIVILDACRNNPFSAINKTTGRGLAIVDAPNGSLVSYSTAPGTEALDGDGVNSPYTTALLQIGKEPGLPIEQALKRVRLAVSGATHQQQFPWESSSLTADFSFLPAAAGQEHLIKASIGRPQTAAGSRPEGRSVEFLAQGAQAEEPAGSLRDRHPGGQDRGLSGLSGALPLRIDGSGGALPARSAAGGDRLAHRGDRQHGSVLSSLPRQLRKQRSQGNRQSPHRTGARPVGVQPVRCVRRGRSGLPVQPAGQGLAAPEAHRSGAGADA